MTKLNELLGQYFDAAYQEGKEGREHDSEDGAAQRAMNAIQMFFKDEIARETESCAKILEMTNSEIRLLAGELSSQEMRTTQAILKNRAVEIRARAK